MNKPLMLCLSWLTVVMKKIVKLKVCSMLFFVHLDSKEITSESSKQQEWCNIGNNLDLYVCQKLAQYLLTSLMFGLLLVLGRYCNIW